MADGYGERITRVLGVFATEPAKAGALFDALNAITDRIRAIEEENARLRASVVKLGGDPDLGK